MPGFKSAWKQEADQKTYLGDVINKNGKIKQNIEARKNKGYSIVANIIAIIKKVPLAHWKIAAGLQLRQDMLINGILFNSKAWHNITEDDLNILEKVDEALLRGILKSHSKIQLEALYLETASIPIRFIVASRRLLYLYNILQKSEDEMIRKVYELQKQDTSQGDVYELVNQDKQRLNVNLSDVEISQMNRAKFKSLVKS